jgi:hypothetical protein
MGFFSTIKPSNPNASSSPKGPMPEKIPPKAPEKTKDTSMFRGGSTATQRQRLRWMRENRDYIWKSTRHRITKAKIPEYEKGLFNSPRYRIVEKINQEPEQIERKMQKKLRRTGSFKERQRVRQDIGIIGRMFGSGKK